MQNYEDSFEIEVEIELEIEFEIEVEVACPFAACEGGKLKSKFISSQMFADLISKIEIICQEL